MHRLTAEEEAPAARKGVQQQHRRRLPSSLSSSSRLPNDLVICATAYSHLSCFTRSTLLCLGCILVLLTTYEFAFDKGVREQMRDIGGEGGGVEMGSGNGIMKCVDLLKATKMTPKDMVSVKTVLLLRMTKKEEEAVDSLR